MAETDNRPDFSKIFASNSPLTPYTFTDENYLMGWQFIGSTPPSRAMFDAYMRTADIKLKWLYDNAFSEESMGGYMFWRLPETAYFVNELRTFKNGPLDVFLQCVTAGKSSADAVESMPDGKKVGDSWQDGTVVWTIKRFSDATAVQDDLTNHNASATAHQAAFAKHIIISKTEPPYQENSIWIKPLD